MSKPKVLAIAIGMLFIPVVFVGCDDGCGNTPVARFPSPDDKHVAVVFERDCGATTGFSTQVSLLGSGETLDNGGGNLFVADSDHGAAPPGPRGGLEVRVRWTSSNALELSHHQAAHVFKAERSAKGVTVTYSTF